MTVSVPPDIERALHERANQLHLSFEEIVSRALGWYVQIDAELLDELQANQEAHDEAFRLVEGLIDGKG